MTMLADAPPIPQRFQTAPATLWTDRFMTHFIKVGGVGIIAAVLGIFIFILIQILPLFRGASVRFIDTLNVPKQDYSVLGVDEWQKLPFLINKKGEITFISAQDGRIVHAYDPAGETLKNISAFRYHSFEQEVLYGTEDGNLFTVKINFKPTYQNQNRVIQVSTETGTLYPLGQIGGRILDVAYGTSASGRLMVAVQSLGDTLSVHAVKLIRKETLLGTSDFTVLRSDDLTPLLQGRPTRILVNSHADSVIVATDQHKVFYFQESAGELKLRQTFMPFGDQKDPSIQSLDYVFGEVSLSVTHPAGLHRIFSLFIPKNSTERQYGQTKALPPLNGPVIFYDSSLRNKSFLMGTKNMASLRHATTGKIRWQESMPFEIKKAVLGRKYDSLFLLDTEHQLHRYHLEDPHPEAGAAAFFGKIWYEGYTHPEYSWQSTGGTDDFEPKLSLVPLIIGTLKGTFYAMLFALPLALLSAIYTSQFAHPKFRILIKPVMEIMASLPSVVLGFLAALWLAPLVESRVPSLLCILILIPLFAIGGGWLWTSLPTQYRKWIKPGYEWLAMIPLMAAACYVGWILGPEIEKIFFVATDPKTGLKIPDFRLWWPQITGTSFQQRNSLVVGFMMAFAVIPIIFTVSEDALTNVPRSLISGSLALGASRWQTAFGVVVPTAFPGIFSAMMIGLGRAVGETMIVVMATGNTPIMDFNLFSGMRTLSANIAVELPEAPYLGTLYRALFLGAMVLFLMTFFVNTIADIIRQHYREKYKTV